MHNAPEYTLREYLKVSCLSNIDCVILAGGYGTRLKLDIPKVLANVEGRPFLSILLERLKKFGAERIILSLGHGAQLVVRYLRDNEPDGLAIIPCVEQFPVGTLYGLNYVRTMIRSELVLVVNGDTLVDIDLCEFISRHRVAGGAASVLCDLDNVSTGVCLFSQIALDYISYLTGFCLEEILPKIPTNYIKMDCSFLDIGTPDDLEQAPAFIKEMRT